MPRKRYVPGYQEGGPWYSSEEERIRVQAQAAEDARLRKAAQDYGTLEELYSAYPEAEQYGGIFNP